ncbi:MAG TPA: hypothetical protein VF135_03330 [Terriglobales bacterium]
MRILIAVASVWAILFAVPFVIYGTASSFLHLEAPAEAVPFLWGVAVTKLGTALAFVGIFALSRNAWRSRWFTYGAIWFLMFAASEIGDIVQMATSPVEGLLGIFSEAIYAPVSALTTDRLLR